MHYTLRFFFSSKCSLFHNANFFGSCVIHILYTECAEIKENNSGAKGLKCGVAVVHFIKVLYMILSFAVWCKIYKIIYSVVKIQCWLYRCGIRPCIKNILFRSVRYGSRPCAMRRVVFVLYCQAQVLILVCELTEDDAHLPQHVGVVKIIFSGTFVTCAWTVFWRVNV